MWDQRKRILFGADESYLQKFIREKSALGVIDCEIGPRLSSGVLEREFGKCHWEPLTLVIRLATNESGKVTAMDRHDQETLLPFVDDFAGHLLVLYAPRYVPILRTLRSRCEPADVMQKIDFRKPKGRLGFLSEAISAGSDRALRRSFITGLEAMMRKANKGRS